MNQIMLSSKILSKLDDMNKKCDGLGNNPFVVNVVTFTGHGITFNDDAIALIPEYEDKTSKSNGKDKVLRFINMSHWAR
jgi:hypothetical protein